jgi:crossover junction endodeoxyribonuclease RuvC
VIAGPVLTVLGVDPGTHACGWGVVTSEPGGRLRAVAAGVVRARERDPIETRLRVVARGLREVVERHRPSEAALEEVFYGRDVRAAVRIGEGRGAALVVLAEAGIPVRGYANNSVKRSVTGSGRAGKTRVLAMVRAILGDVAGLADGARGPALDASDALALAICHHHARTAPTTPASVARPTSRFHAAVLAARARDRLRASP